MSQSANHKHGKSGGSFLTVALGAALATAAGYMYVTHKEEIDKEAKKRIHQLAKLFKQSKPQIEKRVREIWGDVNTNGISTYLDLRGMLLHALENEVVAQKGQVLKKRYDEIVDKVIDSARKSGMLTPEIEKKLADTFKMDWNEMQQALTNMIMMGASKTAQVLKKVNSSKQAKAAKKAVSATARKLVKRAQKKMTTATGNKKSASLKKKTKKASTRQPKKNGRKVVKKGKK